MNSLSDNSLLTLAQQEIDESGAELAGAYRKATRALVKYFPSGQLLFSDFTQAALRDWIVSMLCNNCSLRTVLYYLENVAAIYNKGVKLGQARKTNSFSILKAELLATQGDTWGRGIKDSLNSLSRLAKGSLTLRDGDMRYYADLLLFSFYNRGLAISEILNLTSKDLEGMPEEALKIAEKYRIPRRERIFPRGAVDNVEKRTKMMAHYAGIDTPPDMSVGEITARLWILAALRLGIPASTIAQCRLPQTADLALLNFAQDDEVDISEEEVRRITSEVARSVIYNPLRWHVMKLRPHRAYEEVVGRLKTSKFKHIEYFYPQDEISHKIGKKLEFERKPILPYVVFFRSKDTDIAPMFKQIGDLAWCYRYTSRGAYAVISSSEMDRFQRTIGHFTPDFSIEPLGTTSVSIGERVRITGGPMAGYEGVVYKIDEPTSSTSNVRLFRLHVIGANGIEWKLAVDERQIEILITPPHWVQIVDYQLFATCFRSNIEMLNFETAFASHSLSA